MRSKQIGWLMLSLVSMGLSGSRSDNPADEQFGRIIKTFVAEYRKLGIRPRELSYAENLNGIQDTVGLERQRRFFEQATTQANTIRMASLSETNRLYYQQWRYELALHQERVALEQQYRRTQPTVTDEGLLRQPLGQDWYRYFLKSYLSISISPEELKTFGLQEMQKVQTQIKEVQKKLGYESDSAAFYAYMQQDRFVLTDEAAIRRAYQQQYQLVQQHLPALFEPASIPPLSFAPIPNVDQNSPPAFYRPDTQTFYFNFYGQRHNTRALDFLLLHEGVPGHHYQISLAQESPTRSPLASLVNYGAYLEGWAAYCEELGQELGLYQTPEAYYGKLEWDLVRSARVVMDVGLNYDGWSQQQALSFWRANIPGQEEIAQREINRMIRWPVQVHTYKVGAAAFLELRQKAQRQAGSQFNLRQFHQQVLRAGPLPLAVMNQ